jgi:phenylalanyl-tRNA synthetase beta chain
VPPTWRPDLTGTAELVEEVVRLEGYDTIPVVLPRRPAGRGPDAEQRLRRTRRGRSPRGLVEVVLPPFVGEAASRRSAAGGPLPRVPTRCRRRRRCCDPTLLPGPAVSVVRNTSRGSPTSPCSRRATSTSARLAGRRPGVDGRPTAEQRAALDAALPGAAAPRRAGPGRRAASWDAAVQAVVELGRALGSRCSPRAAAAAPYHPGRTPSCCSTAPRRAGRRAAPARRRLVGLPRRTCAAEADLDALVAAAAARGPAGAGGLALPAGQRRRRPRRRRDACRPRRRGALREGAGALLEALRLFDVFTGPQVGEGKRSLAYALRLRAPDRTLTDVEVLGARDAAVAEAAPSYGRCAARRMTTSPARPSLRRRPAGHPG